MSHRDTDTPTLEKSDQEPMMRSRPVDVWDAKTFDPELVAILESRTDLVRDYLSIDRKIFLEYDRGRSPHRPLLRPSNPFAADFGEFQEFIGQQMERRTIRAFHYTRLTDDEVAALQRDGIHLSTPETLQRRLDALVAAGSLPRATADALYAQSPFHGQGEIRSGKFWMVSHPIRADESGITPLTAHWGGRGRFYVDTGSITLETSRLGWKAANC